MHGDGRQNLSTTLRVVHFRRRLLSLPLRVTLHCSWITVFSEGRLGLKICTAGFREGCMALTSSSTAARKKTTWNELVRPVHAPTLHRYRPFPFQRVQVSCSPASLILRDIRGIRQVPYFDEFGL